MRRKPISAMRASARAFLAIVFLFNASLPVNSTDTFHPVVRGRRGVVAGGHPLAVAAGLRILERGGNGRGAGVATILAASVLEFSPFSFGGGLPIRVQADQQ